MKLPRPGGRQSGQADRRNGLQGRTEAGRAVLQRRKPRNPVGDLPAHGTIALCGRQIDGVSLYRAPQWPAGKKEPPGFRRHEYGVARSLHLDIAKLRAQRDHDRFRCHANIVIKV